MKRVPVRILRVPFLVPPTALAQVPWFRTILVRKDVSLGIRILAHELCHVDQWERYKLGMVVRYLTGLRLGYWDNPLEVEARKAERNPDYISWAESILSGVNHDQTGVH